MTVIFTKRQMMRESARVQQQNTRAQQLGLEATLTVESWIEILNRFEGCCAYCHQPFRVLEHIVPLAQGGGTTLENCIPACSKCNTYKSASDICAPDLSLQEKIKRVQEFLDARLQGLDTTSFVESRYTDDFQTIRIWSRSHKRLRKIAAETGESIVQVLDRLSEQEWLRVQQLEKELELNEAAGPKE